MSLLLHLNIAYTHTDQSTVILMILYLGNFQLYFCSTKTTICTHLQICTFEIKHVKLKNVNFKSLHT